MAASLEHIIREARALSPGEQVELIGAVSQFLDRSYQQSSGAADFWEPKTIDELIDMQGVQPIQDITRLAVDEWLEDESADDVNSYIYGQRQLDRPRGV
jgi:hypothetical protein